MNKLKAFLAVSASFTLLSVLGCAGTYQPFVEQPIEGGKRVPGESLIDRLAWLESNADSRNTYIVEVNANENVAPRTFEYEGATNVKIVIRGIGENRTLRLASHGTMFTIRPNVQLILDSNITLMGHSQNTGPMVNVDGGKFVMRTGSRISGNARGTGDGGGVYVRSGEFYITGGTISGNTATNGGGVYVAGGTFGINGGTISGNVASNRGGGVYSYYHFSRSKIASDNWSAVIIGYYSDKDNGNVVRDEAGNVIITDDERQYGRGYSDGSLGWGAGHAVFCEAGGAGGTRPVSWGGTMRY